MEANFITVLQIIWEAEAIAIPFQLFTVYDAIISTYNKLKIVQKHENSTYESQKSANNFF